MERGTVVSFTSIMHHVGNSLEAFADNSRYEFGVLGRTEKANREACKAKGDLTDDI